MQFYKRAISYFRDDLGKIILSLFFTLGFVVLGVVGPIPMQILIDSVLTEKPGPQWFYRWFAYITPHDKFKQVLILAGLMLLMNMASEVMRMFQTLLNIRIGYNGMMRVRCDLFKKLQALSLAYHKSQPQGDAIYRMSNDSMGFQTVLNVIVGILVNSITLLTMAYFMLLMNWRLTLVSLAITPRGVRQRNQFSWAPMQEVAKLFIGIFLTMIPVLAMLKAGEAGAFAAVTRAVTGADGQPLPWAYFWLSGALSSLLDNAPTYLVFFNLAGGDPQVLMTTLASTLAAVSAGSVFMGANTYIGNAPNFMVKAIAEDRGIRMPGFFGYMAWSGAVLLPLFALMSLIWF